MFDHETLRTSVKLREKSYALLKWVNASLKRGSLDFSIAHQAMTIADAAAKWIERHMENIPLDVRPAEGELRAFACLFSSYLTTSFDIEERPGLRRPRSGCDCMCCSYLVSADHLKTRNPGKRAKRDALTLKRIYLESLASDLGTTTDTACIDRLLSDADLSEKISLASYAHELIRRMEFASQGEGVLVLWREIAWEEGYYGGDPKRFYHRPKRRFQLSAERILEAERLLVERLSVSG